MASSMRESRSTGTLTVTHEGSCTIGSSSSSSSTNITTTSSHGPAKPISRYDRLRQLYQTAMTQARTQMNVNHILQECYGEEELAIFQPQHDTPTTSRTTTGNPNNNPYQSDHDAGTLSSLPKLFELMLDRIEGQVLERMDHILRQHQVEDLLTRVDQAITVVERNETHRKQLEERDRTTAQRAIQNASLPKGGKVAPDDFVIRMAYETLLKERDAIMAQITQMEQQTAQLELERQQYVSQSESGLKQLEYVAKQLEQTADMCSMIAN